MKIATLILELLKRLLDLIQRKKVKDESEKLKENPVDWYNDHFDSPDRVQSDSEQPDADKATDNSDSKQ